MAVEAKLKYEGMPVEYNFFPGDKEYISHGEFRIINNSDTQVEIEFDKCELTTGNEEKRLNTFHVYTNDILVTDKLIVKANSAIKIKITFPSFDVHSSKFRKIEIRSFISFKTIHLNAASAVNLYFEK